MDSRAALLVALALATPWVTTPDLAAETDSSRGASASPAAELREGYLVNFVHRYYIPLSGEWELDSKPEGDYQALHHASLAGAILRILVSPGNSLSLDETMRTLREQAGADPRTHVIEESRTRVAGREAGELVSVREGKGPSDPLTVVRTISFSHGDDKLFLRMEAPVATCEQATKSFDAAVKGLRFEARFGFGK